MSVFNVNMVPHCSPDLHGSRPVEQHQSTPRDWTPWAGWFVVFAIALSLRSVLIIRFPAVYWWDAFTRLWESDHLIVRHWLPLPQLPIFLLDDLQTIRFVFAVSGSLAAVFMGMAIARIVSYRLGLAVAGIYAVLPLFVRWSIVPYQEGFFLMFVGLALAVFPKGMRDGAGMRGWIGSAALAAAALCRYEGWLLVGVLVADSLLRREFSALRFALPTVLVAAIWVITASLRNDGMGPPRLASASSIAVFSMSWQAMVSSTIEALRVVSMKVVDYLSWPVAAVSAWGLAQAIIRRNNNVRMQVVLFFVLVGLTVVRSVNAQTTTDRMLLLPIMWLICFAGVGIRDILKRLQPWLSRRLQHIIVSQCVAAAVLVLGAKAYSEAAENARIIQPEYDVSRELGELPASVNVAIFPRRFSNILNESLIGAIFANNPALDHCAARWYYTGKNPGCPTNIPDVMIVWHDNRYVTVEAPEDLQIHVRELRNMGVVSSRQEVKNE